MNSAEFDALKPTGATVSGEVEVDGAYFGGHVRPANNKASRRDVA
ncbi:hypothetical protein V1290_002825 [Bradyrhizobium sp. AZCC 1578]